MDLGKLSQTEMNRENTLEETRDSHESKCFFSRNAKYSPEGITTK